jgi:hypothetical protein
LAEEEPEDPDAALARLKLKSQQGALNVLEGVLSDPRVQALIRRALTRESFKSGIAFGLLFTGIMMTYFSTKAALGYGWPVDLAVGLGLAAAGALHMWRRSR